MPEQKASAVGREPAILSGKPVETAVIGPLFCGSVFDLLPEGRRQFAFAWRLLRAVRDSLTGEIPLHQTR